MIDPSEQRKAREIFAEACDLDTHQQEKFVRETCGENETLYTEVMSLLRFDAMTESGDGISRGAQIEPMSTADDLPQAVGSYEIQSLIGQGGGGVVYRAYQRTPIERTVALKLIRPGLDTSSILRRFEFERRALERMNHPNIASVLDSGIVDSADQLNQRPYFVMELVEGIPITKYVQSEDLGIRERIELVLQVCAAVQHAHSKGIVHRDIKPSNILVARVDDKPICKVIDFGIAKALDDSASDSIQVTHVGAMVGTPRYMSPEQMRIGGEIDTRTDVYSIGVVLYELLTGRSPYQATQDTHDISALLREIERSDPLRPSEQASLSSEGDAYQKSTKRRSRIWFPRDLDWITLRSLEKDPDRRYQTVAGLADDLRRFLRNEPVDAGPPTVQYKIAKFYLRNRAAVIGSSVAILALITGAVVSSVFAMKASAALELEKTQRELAQRNENRVQDMNDFLLKDLFQSVSSDDLGQDATLVELLDRAAPTIDERFADDVHMRAEVHYLIGDMYGSVYLFDKSLKHLNETESMLDQLDEWTQLDHAQLYSMLGRTKLDMGILDGARADLERSIELLKTLESPAIGLQKTVQAQLASIYGAQNEYDLAQSILREAIEIELAEDEIDFPWVSKLVTNRIAMLTGNHDFEGAVELADWMIEFLKDQDAQALGYPTLVARIHRTNALSRIGRAEEAMVSVEELLRESDKFFGKRSPAYAGTLQTAASTSYRLEMYEQAVEYGMNALELYINLYGPHHYEVERRSNGMALYYFDWGKQEESLHWRTRGLLLRIYVAGPGEDESLLGVTEEGIAVLGSRQAWEEAVIAEFEKVPVGHNKRARYYVNAGIALGVQDTNQDSSHEFGDWLDVSFQAIDDAERPDEIRRILKGIAPAYFDQLGNPLAADEWRQKLE